MSLLFQENLLHQKYRIHMKSLEINDSECSVQKLYKGFQILACSKMSPLVQEKLLHQKYLINVKVPEIKDSVCSVQKLHKGFQIISA